ncbi:hypothetical protein PAXINDRAFT_84703, partial [Paxillus involutus ATCC 200175]
VKLDSANLGAHATDAQRSNLQQRTNALQRRIEHWIQIQTLYMPLVARLRSDADSSAGSNHEEVHAIDLWLPSKVLAASLQCDIELCKVEWRLREAQANDALSQLRQQLRLKSHLVNFKKEWITGQRANTRSQTIIKTVQAKIDAAADKYRAARSALSTLAVPLFKVDWDECFPMLRQEHIRFMTEGLDSTTQVSEGRRLLSTAWIWKANYRAHDSQSEQGSEELQDGRSS